MLISKKTWCFMKGCDGEIIRKAYEDGDVSFDDKCNKCGAKKYTLIHYGNVSYYDSEGKELKSLV